MSPVPLETPSSVEPARGSSFVTAEQFAERSSSQREELVDGKIVAMPPAQFPHGWIILNLGERLNRYARERGDGFATTDEGVRTSRDRETVRAPDLLFFNNERLAGREPTDGYHVVPPVLCVEVISQHDRWSDVQAKTTEYLAAGVDEVWLVDPELRTVTQVSEGRSDTVRCGQQLTSSTLPGFTVPVEDLFWSSRKSHA